MSISSFLRDTLDLDSGSGYDEEIISDTYGTGRRSREEFEETFSMLED